jgi:Rrf2 family protein
VDAVLYNDTTKGGIAVMMLSTTAEYALRIMIALVQSGKGSLTSETIATAAQIPADYAVKVLQALARAELVRAQRGRGGGFALVCDPKRTTMLDVVNAIDPLKRIRACPLEKESHRGGLCPLHQCVDDVLALLEDSLRTMTLQGMIDRAEGSALCAREGDDRAAPEARRGSAPSMPHAAPEGGGRPLSSPADSESGRGRG